MEEKNMKLWRTVTVTVRLLFNLLLNRNGRLFKKYRKQVIAAFTIFNIILLYTITSAAAVITNDQIIDYSFFSPQGREGPH
jgi:hypothetical protein